MPNSIGVFDSGVGGLTVMRQLDKRLPGENIIYLGDTARLPYGNKSKETIIRYSIENTIFLMERNIKLLVIACNTASAYALVKLRQIFNLPIIDVIEAGVEKVCAITRSQRIAVLGTKGTIQSGIYQEQIKKSLPDVYIEALACPLFVPLVEENFLHHPAAHLIVKEYLAPLKDKGIDTILLGCTHYPLLHDLIQAEMGKEVTLVDSATTCAEKVAAFIDHKSSQNSLGMRHYFVSDDPLKFKMLAENIFGYPLTQVQLKPLD